MVERIREGDIPGVQLRCRASLQEEPGTVWRSWTRPERLQRWLAEEVHTETSPPALSVTWRDVEGRLVRSRWVTVGEEPPRRWIFDLREVDSLWPAATRVTLELDSHGDSTEVSVLQEGFAHLDLSACLTIWESYRRFWRGALDRLATRLASGDL